MTPVTSITRQSTHKKDEPLNILTFPTHERYETGLCKTGHNFYSLEHPSVKKWNTTFGKIPDNYTIIKNGQFPTHVGFDLILSQNKFGQFQLASQLARQLHLPLVSLEHTLPMEHWTKEQRQSLLNMRGDINVFISEHSVEQWGFESAENVEVIHHSVDTDLFKPFVEKVLSYGSTYDERKKQVLSVVNDWVNRDHCCGFKIWQRVSENLPVKIVGDTPGLSVPARDVKELVKFYQESLIFLNTSTVSPVPTALLEAMACGCAVVSTATCMIPSVITDGVNGFLSNDESVLKARLEYLLSNPSIALAMGEQARKTVLDKFSPDVFINKWNSVFERASHIPYLSETK